MIKTMILIAVIAVIAYYALKSVIKMLKGEGGCSCGNSSNCKIKDRCKGPKK